MCHAWNARTGSCGGRNGGCRIGLTHGTCNVCGKNGHRACDIHGDVYEQGKHPDGKKGKKGDDKKGKKGEGKYDKKGKKGKWD